MVRLKPDSVTEQTRFSADGRMHIENRRVSGSVEFPGTVLESGQRFSVHLEDGPMTRLVLDQRETRRSLMKNQNGGRSFLNPFAHSGTFSISAHLSSKSTTT